MNQFAVNLKQKVNKFDKIEKYILNEVRTIDRKCFTTADMTCSLASSSGDDKLDKIITELITTCDYERFVLVMCLYLAYVKKTDGSTKASIKKLKKLIKARLNCS